MVMLVKYKGILLIIFGIYTRFLVIQRICIFSNWSRFGSYNVYLHDTRISYTNFDFQIQNSAPLKYNFFSNHVAYIFRDIVNVDIFYIVCRPSLFTTDTGHVDLFSISGTNMFQLVRVSAARRETWLDQVFPTHYLYLHQVLHQVYLVFPV